MTTNATGDAAPARHRRKEARPREILDAALNLFVKKGYAATRMDEVAAQAGVTKGTVYLYFESKEALFKAVIREGIVPVLAYGETLLAEHGGDPEQLLGCLLKGWWERIGSTPLGGIPKLVLAEAGNFPELARFYQEEVIARGRSLLRAALHKGVEAGVFRPLDDELACQLLMAPLIQLAAWQHAFGVVVCGSDVDAAAYIETHLDLVMGGLLVRPPAGEKS